MNSESDQICRLCLKLARNGFREIDETIKQLFNILLLKLDLDISEDSVICQDCMEVTKICLYFKSMCIDTEKIILSCSLNREKIKHNIKIIYEERIDAQADIDEDLDICRFCLTRGEWKNLVSWDTLMNDTMLEMLTKYLPEMDFKIIEDPVSCTTCRNSLNSHCQFLLNCFDIECKIKTSKKETSNNTCKIKFSNEVLEYPVKCQQTCEIERESNRLEEAKWVHPEAYCGLITQEDLDIKDEGINFNVNSSDIILDKQDDEGVVRNDASEIRIYNHAKKMSDLIKHKDDVNRSSLIQKNTSELQKCQSVQKGNSKKNIIYKCSLCAYQAKQNCSLKAHMLVHKDVSEIKMYKCSLCPYEAKLKRNFNHHMLGHKDVSQIQMYRCSSCAYETRHKRYLSLHKLVHKDMSQLKIYKCPLCTYEAKQKDQLTTHMLAHKNVCGTETYKCASCDFETKLKSCLKMHMLRHKEVSQIDMYECSLCAYETIHKYHLKRHMFVHKDVSEVKMYKCSFCASEFKQRSSLTRHMLVHKDVSKIKMYKCSSCAFETKYKSNLKKHMLIHEDVSE